MANIEDADIVIDLSGGELASKAYRARIKQLQAENDSLQNHLKAWQEHYDADSYKVVTEARKSIGKLVHLCDLLDKLQPDGAKCQKIEQEYVL